MMVTVALPQGWSQFARDVVGEDRLRATVVRFLRGMLQLPSDPGEGPEEKREKQQVEQTYEHAISDPGFKHGTRLKGAHVPFDVKRFVVEMYQQTTKRHLVKHS